MPKSAKSATQSLPCLKLSPAEEAEYAALEAALRGSNLGRRFLADYARQHPTPEVQLLLDAIARLETAEVALERRCPSLAIVSELVSMSDTISRMRREIGELRLAPDALSAPSAFDQIVGASARATSDVLLALEEIQNVSWRLREIGVASEFCDRLDDSAADIYTACARQEMAGQKASEAMGLLRDMETRIDALLERWSDYETRNLLDAAKALDVSDALESAAPQKEAEPHSAKSESQAPAAERPVPPQPDAVQKLSRTNRLGPVEDLVVPGAEADRGSAKSNGRFEPPPPLTMGGLDVKQRTALFG